MCKTNEKQFVHKARFQPLRERSGMGRRRRGGWGEGDILSKKASCFEFKYLGRGRELVFLFFFFLVIKIFVLVIFQFQIICFHIFHLFSFTFHFCSFSLFFERHPSPEKRPRRSKNTHRKEGKGHHLTFS